MTFVYDISVEKFNEILWNSVITNQNYSYEQFKKNFNDNEISWCMLFDANKKCVAAASVKEGYGPASNSTYVNEIQCLESGKHYGKKMLMMLIKHYRFVWLMADPSVKSDKLLNFYRDPEFRLNEYVLPANQSIYDIDTHFFMINGRMHSSLIMSFLKSQYGKQLNE